MIEAKNEETRQFLERIQKTQPDKPLKLAYSKTVKGRVIEQIWVQRE